jgi:hypothetical protein
MKTNTSIVIKPYDNYFYPEEPKTTKESIVESSINPSKYRFLGFVDRTSQAILEARYHNVRDNFGRFTAVYRD